MNDEERVMSWRDRAEELRMLAESAVTLEGRDDLIALAEQWESMACRISLRLAEVRDPYMPQGRS